MKRSSKCISPGAVVALALLTSPARCQNVAGTVKATIVDAAAAAVPTAQATLTNNATALAVKTTSNPLGIVVFPGVAAGTYTLTVQAAGFQQYVRTGIDLTIGEIRDLGVLTLRVGEIKQSIEVADVTTPLQTASGEKSGLVTGTQLNDLALKGRDFFALTATMPGVIDVNGNSRDATAPGAIAGIYVNGLRQEQKNYTVDGITAMDTGSNTSVHYEPNMDSIAEVKVLTSNFQAEYGRNAGGTISVITRGGSQQYHGSGWWTHRNEQFNANNFFNNTSGLARAPYRYNIAGFSLGGPVSLRKFNSDKSKLFFFVSQEYTRQRIDSGIRYVNMPTALERQGNFSQSVDVNGKLIPATDPSTGAPFPGNIVPASRINPVGQAILNFYPVPNYTDPSPALVHQRNYAVTASGAHPRRDDMVRMDVNPVSNLHGYFRWIQDTDTQTAPYQSTNFGRNTVEHPNPGHGYAAALTYTISPRLLNEFTLGKGWNSSQLFPNNPALADRTVLGSMPQWYPNKQTDPGSKSEAADALLMPNIAFGGTPVNPPTFTINNLQHTNHNDTWDIIDNISYVVGSHQFKTGVFVNLTDKVQVEGDTWNGTLNFAVNKNNPFDSGHSYANALLGNFNTYLESTTDIDFHAKYWGLEFFVQDNWRVTRKLTLDYGIRFYHMDPQYDLKQTVTAFSPANYNPAQVPRMYRPGLNSQGQRVGVDSVTGAQVPVALVGTFVPGSGNFANGMIIGGQNGVPGGLYTVRALSATPRFGFAYDLSGKGTTVVRGGFGIFEDRSRQLINNSTTSNPPVSYTPTAYYGNLSTLSQASGFLGPSSVSFLAPIAGTQMPAVMSYSLGIQKQLPFSTMVDVSYVGNLSRHDVQTREVNPIPLFGRFNPANADPTVKGQPLPDNFFRPYAGFAGMTAFEFAGSANYNSLQVSGQRRFTRNLGFGASFTFSKALGVANAYNTAVSSYFPARSFNYGPVAFDRSKVFSLNYAYDLPDPGKKLANRFVSAVMGKWTFSGITTFMSGAPLTPSFSNTVTQDTTGSSDGARITVIGNPRLDKSEKSFSRNFAQEAFAVTKPGSFGNGGTGIVRGPGLNNWDVALNKRIPVGLGERRTLQFRVEAYNAFNHTQFTTINTAARFDPTGQQVNANFGAFTAAAPGRILSFALRFQF